MAYSELPSFARPLLPKVASPARRSPTPRVLLCGIALASLVLGCLLLTRRPAAGLHRASRPAAAAAQPSSPADVHVAMAVAAAAVLPQQLPLRADLPQGGPGKAAKTVSAEAADSDTSGLQAKSAAEKEREAEEAEADRLISADGSMTFLSDAFDDIIAYDSAGDANMAKPEDPKALTQERQDSAVGGNSIAHTQDDTEEQQASELWHGKGSSGTEHSRSGGSNSKLSPQDAEIAALLEAAALQGEQPVDMAKCLLEDGLERPFSVDDFLKAAPARLKVEAQFSSRLPRAPTAITMLVTGTTERKDMLPGLCESYGSVISLAVYVGVLAGAADAAVSIANTVADVASVFDRDAYFNMCRLEAAGACQLDILVVSERLETQAAMHLFPINALRNLALLNARTDLVMLGDLDLLAGADLAAAASNAQQYQELLRLTDGNRLVVVPAFESDSKATALAAAAGGKAMAASLWKGTPDFRYFLQNEYDSAHEDTRFDLWVAAEHPYTLNETDPGFEPWWIGRRADVSVYDSKYRGYGKNKVQHLQMLKQLLGFGYIVHPRAFIVHRPHAASAAKTQFNAEIDSLEPAQAPDAELTTAASPAAENLNIFVATEEWFGSQWRADKAFRPQVTRGFRGCRDQLQHWSVFGPDGEPIKTAVQADAGLQQPL